jgi:xanthine dehydrogenase YagS FAD-binding subunit
MQGFDLARMPDLAAASRAGASPGAAFIAGGTDLMQLMKDNIETPSTLIDLDGLLPDGVEEEPDGIRLGALARMSDVAAHPAVRAKIPAVSEALLSAASPQVRNMGTMGGNLLQRTRCGYFRDTGFPCNKREPGSGCPAIAGENRLLAVLGGSPHCIATQPSDMPVALVALDATLQLQGQDGAGRTVRVADFYRQPGESPDVDTVLVPGELVVSILVPVSAASRRSRYLKVRDRASFEFALVSAAVGLDVEDGMIRQARVAMGGVGTVPWRLPQVEAALAGQKADDASFRAVSSLAAEGAQPASRNGFKLRLMQRTVFRALQLAAA